MEEPPFYVDRAKGGRASCKACRNSCPGGELRLAKMVIGRFGDHPAKSWYHVDCLMTAFMKQRPSTKRISSTAMLGNFDNLSPEDKSSILKTLNDTEKEYAQKHNIDYNPIKESSNVDDEPSTSGTSTDIPKVDYDLDHKDNKFEAFCELCTNISKFDKYLDKTAIVMKMFSKGTDNNSFKSDVGLWCRLLLPGAIKRIYNLKNKQLVKLFARIFQVDHDDMLTDLEKGNIAETIRTFFEKSPVYEPASFSTLTVFEVDTFLDELSTMTKEDEQVYHFKKIVKRCSENDLKVLIQLINGDLRMNAGPKHILEGVHPDAYKVFQASRDIDIVISRVMSPNKNDKNTTSPVKNQVEADIILMKPVLPMLAEACKSFNMAMEKCKNGMLSEIKYDGERVQVHKKGSEFKYFSRSLKPVMAHKVGRLKDFIPKAFPHGKDLILDSEILMIDTETGKILPFGSLGVHKKEEYKNAEVCLFVFDCIYYNGESLINEPMIKRRKILKENMKQIKNHVMLSEVKVITKEDDLKRMTAKVFKEGQEGLVMKDLQSKYEPGKRHWLKLKKDYLYDGAMADSADLVVLGAWFGTGKKGGMLSVFLMGCYDEARNRWLTVTKVHTGHDDDTLASLQNFLQSKMDKISKDSSKIPSWLNCTKTMVPDFIAKDPKNQPVWEISGTEFTKAQIHTADGISIRFPRVTKIRDDKCWQTATNLKELQKLYKTSSDSVDWLSIFKVETKDEDGPGSEENSEILEIYDIDDINSCSFSEDLKDLKTTTVKKNVLDFFNSTKVTLPDTKSLESSNQKSRKRKLDSIDEMGDNAKSKNTESKYIEMNKDSKSVSFKESKVKQLMPLHPLPNIFEDCVFKFYSDCFSHLSDSSVKNLKRFCKAYGGFEDQTADASEATHVIHYNKLMKLKDLMNDSYNFSKEARHVTLHWLKDSLMLKKLQDTRHYSVTLIK